MAAVKKSIWSNIIKMKLTEENRFWSFRLRLFFAKKRLNVRVLGHTDFSSCDW